MIIEDEELRTIFKAESDEHLQKLEEGLLRLEQNPADVSTLGTLFREAHSLKGAARMLGVEDVERIAHHFEDALGAAKRSERTLTPAAVDRMCGALDAIRKLVEQAVTGEPSGIDADRIIEQLASQDAPISNAEGDVPFSVENTAQEPLANDGGPYRIEPFVSSRTSWTR